ncbi:hypothetical protein AX15_001914 [Amanita polypyramis BW_CC]|nr:hypothetical protein AX15_001914 [Amanita polypyramis BW_CC]
MRTSIVTLLALAAAPAFAHPVATDTAHSLVTRNPPRGHHHSHALHTLGKIASFAADFLRRRQVPSIDLDARSMSDGTYDLVTRHLEARDFDDQLEARDFYDGLEARDFDDSYLEARDFDDDYLEVRGLEFDDIDELD